MYHPHFYGTHNQIGAKWGSTLRKNGVQLLEQIPFEMTEERMNFSQLCLPYYERHFPEIVEEIKGIAQGQQCPVNSLMAVLFSMYCIMPSAHCSCFAVKLQGGEVLLGRNSDFLTQIEKLTMNTLYSFSGSSYAFQGNTTAFVEMEDGINQYGLAIGLTSVAPRQIQPGLNAGMLLRLFLEKCKSVEDVIALLSCVPIASCQTFVAADAGGNAVLIECSPQNSKICTITEPGGFVCATNLFHLEEMKPYTEIPEDTWFAEERYQTMQQCLLQHAPTIDIDKAQGLLAGQEGFLCQYDRKTGKDTVWSVLYDLKSGEVYRAEGNPCRKPFQKDNRSF